MTVNPDWLLNDDGPCNMLNIIACDDPAESLARHARHLGWFTLELIGMASDDEDEAALHDGFVGHQARLAFRFAHAALRLEAYKISVQFSMRGRAGRVQLVLDDEPEGPEPEWRKR